MPKNTVMLSNEAALREGFERAAWKRNLCLQYFNNVTYNLAAISPFDDRDLFSLIPLLVDISSVADKSDDEKKAYFISQLKIIERDFVLTKDPSTRLHYLRRMYEEVRTDLEIDWNDAAQIDHLVCSTASQQMLGMMGVKLPREVFSLYNTKDEAKRLDNISIKNFINTRKFQNAVSTAYPELNKAMGLGSVSDETPCTAVQDDITLALAKAIDEESNVAMLDPTAVSRFTKKILLGDPIYEERYDPDTEAKLSYDRNELIREFMGRASSISMQAVNEFKTTEVYGSFSEKNRFLFINGRSVKDLVDEKMKNENIGEYDAQTAVGEMMRNALVDGKSVVSLMRPVIIDGGKVSFSHQEIKVDLDKLNKIERKEKHNIFRRILHTLGIKIRPKYPSNDERDRNQEAIKSNSQYQVTMKTAEKNFINAYNERSQQKRDREMEKMSQGKQVVQDVFLNAFPKISAADHDSELDTVNQSIHNNQEKERLTTILEDLEEDKEYEFSEPINEQELDRSIDRGSATK